VGARIDLVARFEPAFSLATRRPPWGGRPRFRVGSRADPELVAQRVGDRAARPGALVVVDEDVDLLVPEGDQAGDRDRVGSGCS